MTKDGSAQPPRSLIEAFSEIAQRIHTSEDYDDSLRRITETATGAIRGCDAASLSLIENGAAVTRAATSDLALAGDQIQYEENEGPCLDAATELYSPDLGADSRWPTSSSRIARELGVGSMISCRLTLDAAPNHTLGGLNIYSKAKAAFSDEDQMMSILLASLGAVVVDASRQQAHLRAAIQSRQVIGEAIGILRAQQDVSSEEAFAMLSNASQRMNVKLRELAVRITTGAAHADGPRPTRRTK
jgi:GAF domain-containing protein